jgi:hypothetical protein
MEIIARYDAQDLGLKRYFTGRAYRRGHISERYTSNGMCCTCLYKPVGNTARVTVEVHRDDVSAVHEVVRLMNSDRGIQTREPLSADERDYWAMVRRFRSHGAPASAIPRSLRSFTLPEGVDP